MATFTFRFSPASEGSLLLVSGYVTTADFEDTTYEIIVEDGVHAGTYEVDAADMADGPVCLHPGSASGTPGVGNVWTLDDPGLWAGLASDGPIILTNEAYTGAFPTGDVDTYTQETGDSSIGINFVVTATNQATSVQSTVVALEADAYTEPKVLYGSASRMGKAGAAASTYPQILLFFSGKIGALSAERYWITAGSADGYLGQSAANGLAGLVLRTTGTFFLNGTSLGYAIGDRVDAWVMLGTLYSERVVYVNGVEVLNEQANQSGSGDWLLNRTGGGIGATNSNSGNIGSGAVHYGSGIWAPSTLPDRDDLRAMFFDGDNLRAPAGINKFLGSPVIDAMDKNAAAFNAGFGGYTAAGAAFTDAP